MVMKIEPHPWNESVITIPGASDSIAEGKNASQRLLVICMATCVRRGHVYQIDAYNLSKALAVSDVWLVSARLGSCS